MEGMRLIGRSLRLRGVRGGAKESIPQGLKPQIFGIAGRPKAEALGYLDARTPYPYLDARTLYPGLDARTPYPCLDAKTLYAARVAFALLVSCFCLTACAPPRSSRITIGAKNFTEQVVLGELLSQEIEAVTGQAVERRFYLAGSYLCQQALVSGRIDGYVEYTGTALTAILKQPLPPVGQRDEATVFRRVSELYASRYGVKVGRGLGFEDTFAMVVRGEDARRLGVKTISDAVRVAARIRGSRRGLPIRRSGGWGWGMSLSRGRMGCVGWRRLMG